MSDDGWAAPTNDPDGPPPPPPPRPERAAGDGDAPPPAPPRPRGAADMPPPSPTAPPPTAPPTSAGNWSGGSAGSGWSDSPAAGWGQATMPPPPPRGPAMAPVTAPPGERPRVPVGAVLAIVGGALVFLAGFLPWTSFGDTSFNGLDSWVQFNEQDGNLYRFDSPGTTFLIGGVILAAIGLVTLLAGRYLAVAIIGIVLAAIGVLMAAGVTVILNEGEATGFTSGEQSVGIGPPLAIVGAVLTLAGSIVITAKRRPR